MIKNQVKTLEDLVEEYKERKVNYSTYEFDDLSYRTLILDIHTMLKENKKYKEVIDKIKNICDKVPNDWTLCGIDILHYIEKILKEVEHD